MKTSREEYIPLLTISDFQKSKVGQIFLIANQDNLKYQNFCISRFSIATFQTLEERDEIISNSNVLNCFLHTSDSVQSVLFLSYKVYDANQIGIECMEPWSKVKNRCHPFIESYFNHGEMMLFPNKEDTIANLNV